MSLTGAGAHCTGCGFHTKYKEPHVLATEKVGKYFCSYLAANN